MFIVPRKFGVFQSAGGKRSYGLVASIFIISLHFLSHSEILVSPKSQFTRVSIAFYIPEDIKPSTVFFRPKF